jgi:hypothetical protein
MVWGIRSFRLLVGPTQISVEPLCSKSLAPSWTTSAFDTSDKTTFVGKRSSMAASTPRLWVVLTRMQVCWGVTTASMIVARS